MNKRTPRALVLYGLGIGCHAETKLAYETAGFSAELIHFNDLLKASAQDLSDIQIINFSGGFLHGDILGSAMCAVNQLENRKMTDLLWDFSEKGGLIYGQCNGFQLLVKSGLLPAVDNNYQQQVATLSHNDCALYRGDYVAHKLVNQHFAFDSLAEEIIHLFCRHGEGKFLYDPEQYNLEKHILLKYVNSDGQVTTEFPENPNGSLEAIAGLQSVNGRIFGHMAHPEVSVFANRNPDYYRQRENNRRNQNTEVKPDGLIIFENIFQYFG